MNSQKRNPRNLNLKEENCSRFIFGNYSRLLLKSSFNSVLTRLLFFFFFWSLPNVFFLYHSFLPCTLASVRRKCSPFVFLATASAFLLSASWCLSHQSACYDRLGYDMRRAASASVETCLKTCLELPKSRFLIFLYKDLMESVRRFPKDRCSPVEQ